MVSLLTRLWRLLDVVIVDVVDIQWLDCREHILWIQSALVVQWVECWTISVRVAGSISARSSDL